MRLRISSLSGMGDSSFGFCAWSVWGATLLRPPSFATCDRVGVFVGAIETLISVAAADDEICSG